MRSHPLALLFLSLVAAISLFFAGCISFERSVLQDVTIVAFPANASVYINGEAAGITPMQVALPSKVAHEIRFEKVDYNSANKIICPVLNEKADNFIQFGLSENLGYYVDFEPSTMKTKMKIDLAPNSVGTDPFERMAVQALAADKRLEAGEISLLENRYIIEQVIKFFESQS